MFTRQMGWLAALMLLVSSAASAGSRTATLQVSLLITESCGVAALSSGTNLPVQPSQVSVKCAFRTPHVVRVVRETTQPAGGSGASQAAPAAAVTTLEF